MKLNKILTSKFFILLIIISIIAFIPRFLQLFNSSNYYFGPEQGVEYEVTKDILVNHSFTLVNHQGGLEAFKKPAGFNYLLIIPFIAFDGNPFGGRIMMFIISFFSVILTYILFNRTFGIKIASIISFLMAISPSLKDYIGSISPPFIIVILTVLFIYFLYKIINNKLNFIPLIFLLTGLMANFEFATSIILASYLCFLGLMQILKRKYLPLKIYILSILLFFISFLPIVLSDIINKNLDNSKGILSIINKVFDYLLTTDYFSNFLNIFSIFSWNFSSTFTNQKIIIIPIILVLVLGFYLIYKNKKRLKERNFLITLYLIPLFSFIFMFIYPSPVIQQWWFIDLNVIYCFILGFVVVRCWNNLLIRMLSLLIILLLFLGFINRNFYTYKSQLNFEYHNFIAEEYPLRYIFNSSINKKFNLLVISNRPQQQNYKYLIWWYSKKFNNWPGNNKSGLYYVIVEKGKLFKKEDFPGTIIDTKMIVNYFTVVKIIK